MNRVVHFEIHAADPERAAKFYVDVFGWKIKKWDGPADYWLITTGEDGPDLENNGINGAILKRMGENPNAAEPTPVVGYVSTVSVKDLDKSIAAVIAAGGTEATPKMPVPGIGWLAYYKDTESNIFGLLQPDDRVRMPPQVRE
jgi:hypothetical protein